MFHDRACQHLETQFMQPVMSHRKRVREFGVALQTDFPEPKFLGSLLKANHILKNRKVTTLARDVKMILYVDPIEPGGNSSFQSRSGMRHLWSIFLSTHGSRQTALTVVPLPGTDSTLNLPPVCSVLSFIPDSPYDLAQPGTSSKSNPIPSSVMLSSIT